MIGDVKNSMVSLTIQDNDAYCRARGWILTRRVNCECGGNPECNWCGGNGDYFYSDMPFGLRFSRPAFEGLWTALGFYAGGGKEGAVYGNRLLTAIHSLEPAAVMQATSDYQEDEKCRTGERLRRTPNNRSELTYLAYLAIEACRREEMVVWRDNGE